MSAERPEQPLTTDRLVIRAWRVPEADVLRTLWAERDPRVPAHRRIGELGRPTLADLERSIASGAVLDAVESRATGDVVGQCGLVPAGNGSAGRAIAFELLRSARGRGFATEAARAVLERAAASGLEEVSATVWHWNAASRRVLTKLGFVETDHDADGTIHASLAL